MDCFKMSIMIEMLILMATDVAVIEVVRAGINFEVVVTFQGIDYCSSHQTSVTPDLFPFNSQTD